MFMYGVLSKHFNLGLDAPIIEREFEPLTREEMTVWTSEYPRPSGDASGDAHERALVRLWAHDAAEQIAAARDDADEYRKTVGEGWKTILGPTLDKLGSFSVAAGDTDRRDGYRLATGLINGAKTGQQIPSLFMLPEEGWNEQLVIWLSDTGKAGLLDSSEEPLPAVRRLLEEGYAVLGIDMLGQGELATNGDGAGNARLHTRGDDPWQRAAAYTFGYNRPLFVQRVHDVLAAVKAAQTYQTRPSRIHLIGIGREAGVVALAACVQSGDAVAKAAVHIAGFSFDAVTRMDDPMFVPGAVRYDGLAGIRELIRDEVQVKYVSDPLEPDAASFARWIAE
jgi:dienelactone hydrolase